VLGQLLRTDCIFQAKNSTLTDLAEAVEELRERVPQVARIGFEAVITVRPSGKYACFVERVHWSPRKGVFYVSTFQLISKVRCPLSLTGGPELFLPKIVREGTVDQNGDVTLRDGSQLYGASFVYDRRARPKLAETQKDIIRVLRSYLKVLGGILSLTKSDRQIEVTDGAKLPKLTVDITPSGHDTLTITSIRNGHEQRSEPPTPARWPGTEIGLRRGRC